jgi:hypothetical protein
MSSSLPQLQGYLRSDGRKGIRNCVVVAYLVECAHQARGWVLKERPIAKGALTCCSGTPIRKSAWALVTGSLCRLFAE